ncbi:protein hairy-like [Limulus polyphemus]|uniref:Protein hairy-like n=1 Tax=Limulus polyphemus TaxID=6850 RepID=A0ABM1BEZ5_LIMPO|nr:protein hairy-like [Limulus polyphemus]
MLAENLCSKYFENRKAAKPLVEKRRRARFNQSLEELKKLVSEALNRDPARRSKLEKADVLELTVRYLQSLQRQHMTAALATDPAVLRKFRSGFNDCASEVRRYLRRIKDVDHALRQRLLRHLGSCMISLNNATSFNYVGPVVDIPQVSYVFSHLQSLGIQIPGGLNTLTEDHDVNNNSVPQGLSDIEKRFNRLPLNPNRLLSGDFAFILSSQALQRQLSLLVPSEDNSIERLRGRETLTESYIPASSSVSSHSPSGSESGSEVCFESPTLSIQEQKSSDIDDTPKPKCHVDSCRNVPNFSNPENYNLFKVCENAKPFYDELNSMKRSSKYSSLSQKANFTRMQSNTRKLNRDQPRTLNDRMPVLARRRSSPQEIENECVWRPW